MRCPVNDAVIGFLRAKLNLPPTAPLTERAVRSLLIHAAPPIDPSALAHTVVQWDKPKGTTPKWPTPASDTLLDLAIAMDVSLDPLLRHRLKGAPSVGTPHSITPRAWLRQFLEQCNNLSCYVVFVKTAVIEEWRAEAVSITDTGLQARLQAVENWMKAIPIADASVRLRQQHRLGSDQAVGRQTMHSLVQHRLRWIIRAVPEHGERLASIARTEAYMNVYEAIRDGRYGQCSRFPSMRGSDCLSLCVKYDTLPTADDEVGWIVYYNWGAPIDSQDVNKLLAREATSSRTNNH